MKLRMKDDVNTMFLGSRMGQLFSMIDIHFLHMSYRFHDFCSRVRMLYFFFEQHAYIILCGHGSMRELYIVFLLAKYIDLHVFLTDYL
jgi:hypothetical protein